MDQQEINTNQNVQKSKNKVWLILLILILIVIIEVGIYFYFFNNKSGGSVVTTSSNNKPEQTTTDSQEISLSIPQDILSNKFGFLGGGADDDGSLIAQMGAGWMRPHPGAFLWDAMQKGADQQIDFTNTDSEIKNVQPNNLGVLVTIWPFAEWDQLKRSDAQVCAVNANDQFLTANDKKGRGDYISRHRCNPADWDAYQRWVSALVERYDGDGKDDMPGLKTPVKYWEVMNEPDLQWQSTHPGDNLNFYKQGPTEYGTLLVNTSKAIKSADSKANVLISGAAGGDTRFLNFYKEVFLSTPDAKNAFDIGNIHCISNDEQTHDFNIVAYKAMLTEAGISGKSIWVTEAEALYGKTFAENATNTETSVKNALAAGAERIFFTSYNFAPTSGNGPMGPPNPSDMEKTKNAYKELIGRN